MSTENKIKCIKPDCNNVDGEFQYLGEEKSYTVVNAEGTVTFRSGKYMYKCLCCHTTFSSEIAPQHKRLILG
jgi:hypothetical protein